jgi:hypothetical protein
MKSKGAYFGNAPPQGHYSMYSTRRILFFDFSQKKSDAKVWHFEKQNAPWSECLVFQKKTPPFAKDRFS